MEEYIGRLRRYGNRRTESRENGKEDMRGKRRQWRRGGEERGSREGREKEEQRQGMELRGGGSEREEDTMQKRGGRKRIRRKREEQRMGMELRGEGMRADWKRGKDGEE